MIEREKYGEGHKLIISQRKPHHPSDMVEVVLCHGHVWLTIGALVFNDDATADRSSRINVKCTGL